MKKTLKSTHTKHILFFISTCLAFGFSCNSVSAQSMVVSSYFNAADPRDEWTEFVVVQDNLDIRNWTIGDNNPTQTAWQPRIAFNPTPFWRNLRAGTIIVIWHRPVNSAGVSQPEDLDPSDGFLRLRANNAAYFTGGDFGTTPLWNGVSLNMAAAGDIIELRDASNNHVHALAHQTTPGADYTNMVGPKLNHLESLGTNEAVFVCPGASIADYGTNAPQVGTTYTARSSVDITYGLPNICSASNLANIDYWRSLRQPSWPTPNPNYTVNVGNTAVTLTWSPIPDPVTTDGIIGYMVVRNTVDAFTDPQDGRRYLAGEMIGTAVVVNPSLAWSTTSSFVDNISVPQGEGLYYQIYPFKYTTDNINGNNYNIARGRAYNETQFAAFHVTIPNNQPIITNSVSGYINIQYFQMYTPPTSYQLNAQNLTGDLIIDASTSSAYPTECQLAVSLSPENEYSSQIVLSPIGGIIDTTIYVRPSCDITPFNLHGIISHSSPGANTDVINVTLYNEYSYQDAPIVTLSNVQAIVGDTINVSLTTDIDFDICYATYSIDFNPSVVSFIGVVNAPDWILVCNNCFSPSLCSPDPYGHGDCQINTLATLIDSTHSRLQIRIQLGEIWYGGIVVPAGEKYFDIQFLYHGGYTDLTFSDGDYIWSCNGNGLPVIFNEPFEEYYINGSVNPLPPITTNLELNLEGLYNPAIGEMRQARGRVFPAEVADEITVSIAQSTFPYSFEFEVDSVELTRNGHCSVEVPGNLIGEYYIVISHRNSIQTWSKYPVSFNQDTVNYVFSDNIQKAYNNNLKLVTDKYCIYAGDINQDGFVDSGDMTILDNESNQFVMGYNPSDINGDVFTDSGDIVMADNNIYTFTSAYQPGSGVPEVSTAIIHNITPTSAVSGGEVLAQGTSPVLVRGICWNTAPNPTTVNSTSENGSGAGEFTSTMTNLQPNTTYYVRAFATNSETTAYGYQLSFKTEIAIPFLSSTEITELTPESAVSGGTIISDGGASITQRGVCWSASPEPEITDNITNDGTGSGVFVSNLSGLNPNITYYLRAYATNSVGTGYGNELEFTTPANLAELTTEIATNITSNSATSGGTVTNDGGAFITARGVCYSQNPNPTIVNDTTLNGVGSGSFISQLNGLLPNMMYYVRAYATNLAGTAYGNEVSFTTNAELPSLTTEPITSITGTTAISGGIVTGNSGATITQRGICWSTASNPTLSDQFTSDGSGMGTFISNMTGLNLNTTYYVRAYAINSAGTAYGNEVSFTTALFITGNGVTDIEGNTYSSIILGTQEWMGENLKVALYNNGDSIQQVFTSTVWSGLSTGAWCWMNNDNQLENPYGKLYNYYAVTDSRNVCPAGWRMPTDAEWTILTNYLGGSTVAGGKMKSIGTEFWNSPNTAAANTSNFSGLPGGYRTDNGTFGNLGSNGIWWSSTELNTSIAWYRSLLYNSGSSVRSNNQKKYGFSVRCMREVVIPTITTAEVTSITDTSAISGGNITNAGSLPIIQKGVCWSTNQNPTLSDNHTIDGIGTGTFISEITGLIPSTTYYVRAYATNINGTSYGNQQSFTTLINCNCFTLTHTAGSVAPVTKTVTYGTTISDLSGSTKCWITQNLGSDHQATAASDATEASAGWYWQFNRKQGYKHDGGNRTPNTTWIYSIIENSDWQPANDPCTLLLGNGWRLPTGAEWEAADANGDWDNYDETFGSVLKLHAAGWLSYTNGGALNARGAVGEYWSSSQGNSGAGYYLGFNNLVSYVDIYDKAAGYSTRCLKD